MRDFLLSDAERLVLLEVARDAIQARFEKRACRKFQRSPALEASAGAFVTLSKERGLRGCIGRIVGGSPLLDTVRHMAVEAAFADPRFPPLEEGELEDIEIEISVLSPLEPCKPQDVRMGTHGALLSVGSRHAVFLPQVPVEQGWDSQTFFSHLSRKAGLPFDAWRAPEAEVHRFSALVFGERELGRSQRPEQPA